MMTRSFLALIVIVIAGCGRKETSTAPSAPTSPTENTNAVSPPEADPSTSPETDSVRFPSADLSTDVATLIAPLKTEQVRDGWINLFDGRSLFGWESNSPEVNWSVQDGAITADSGPQGLLLTYVPFADYELHCEFLMETGGNSGIFLRTEFAPKEVTADCYELNIVDDHPSGYLTGSFVGRQKTAEAIAGSGGWKTFDVKCEGNTFSVDLNGQRVLDYTDQTPTARPSGLIGLQKNAGKVQFRNVRLRPLRTFDIFAGSDLAGWHVVPGSAATFAATNQMIHGKGGQGFLESDIDFGDFVLQFDAATMTPTSNGGLFFRTEPGTPEAPSNGYEVQINNALTDGDRTLPKDGGTGAIFRRAAARIVAADDNRWTTITLVAAGPRFATWVNGYPVVAFADERDPDANPRKGLRLEPGRLSLQVHDPSTEVLFRALRLAPLP